jgi:predicted amidohydrolase
MNLNILIAQVRPTKANYDVNLARLQDVFTQLHTLTSRPNVLILPETYLSGYYLEGGVREVARSAGQVYTDLNNRYLLTSGADTPPLDIVVGFYERYRDRYYNSALYATLGGSPTSVA